MSTLLMYTAPMRAYPAIVPPAELSAKLQEFSTSLTSLAPGITGERASGPHITLKGPQYPDVFDPWLSAASSAVKGFEPFNVNFDQPTFLSRGVLALLTSAPGLQELNRRLATALAAFNHPTITYFDYDLYTPHVTLAYSPQASHDLRVKLHDRVTTGLLPLPSFRAASIAIFTRNDFDYHYRLSHQIPLA
jgi:2'-5' RNA ligase